METEKNNELENFSFNDAEEIDFFGENLSDEKIVDESDKESTKEEKDEDNLEKDKQEDNESKEIQESLFDEDYEDDDNEDNKNSESNKKDRNSKSDKKKSEKILALEFLQSKGLVDYELEEDAELTEDTAEELLEESFENALDKKIENLFEEMPDEIKQLNKFVLNGGNPDDFFKSLTNNYTEDLSKINENIDLTNTSNQELIVKQGLKKQGFDDEYIKSQIEFLKDTNKLESFAATHFNKWKAEKKAKELQLIQMQKEKKRAAAENKKALKNNVKNLLQSEKNIYGLKVNRQDKEVLPKYMTEQVIKLDNGNTITEMQRDLMLAMRDEKKAVLIAKILKSNFNFIKNIEKDVEDKVAKNVKKNIQRSKNLIPSSASNTSVKKTLADFFN